jgi:hypothetical protein
LAALSGQASCFLNGDERFAGAGTASGDDARVCAKPSEKLTLLLGEPDQLSPGNFSAGTK